MSDGQQLANPSLFRRIYDKVRDRRSNPRWNSMKGALTVWAAEVCIGMLPLAARLLITAYVPDHKLDILPEECILAVVISGLALLSFFEMHPPPYPLKQEPLTCFLFLAALLALLSGASFYAVVSTEIANGGNSTIHSTLGTAVISSLCITIRRALGDPPSQMQG
jgi:hypothetical protein